MSNIIKKNIFEWYKTCIEIRNSLDPATIECKKRNIPVQQYRHKLRNLRFMFFPDDPLVLRDKKIFEDLKKSGLSLTAFAKASKIENALVMSASVAGNSMELVQELLKGKEEKMPELMVEESSTAEPEKMKFIKVEQTKEPAMEHQEILEYPAAAQYVPVNPCKPINDIEITCNGIKCIFMHPMPDEKILKTIKFLKEL